MFWVLIPNPRSGETPFFTGKNVTKFLREYSWIYRRYQTSNNRAIELVEDYYQDNFATEILIFYTEASSIEEFSQLIIAKYGSSDDDYLLGTIEALEHFVTYVIRIPNSLFSSPSKYTRQFKSLYNRITKSSQDLGDTTIVRQYLKGLPEYVQRSILKRLKIDPLILKGVKFSTVESAMQDIIRVDSNLALLNATNMNGPIAQRVQAWTREGSRTPESTRRALPHEKVLPIPISKAYVLGGIQPTPKAPKKKVTTDSDLDKLIKTFGGMKLNAVILSVVLKETPYFLTLSSSQYTTLLSKVATLIPTTSPTPQ